MTRMFCSFLAAAAIAVVAPTAYGHHQKGHTGGNGDGNGENCQNTKEGCGLGLAIGQDPRLLGLTRLSNAGAGNGGEFLKCDKKGCEKGLDVDPGNSGEHNESPECDFIKCDIEK